jgi:hypothetical protein
MKTENVNKKVLKKKNKKTTTVKIQKQKQIKNKVGK